MVGINDLSTTDVLFFLKAALHAASKFAFRVYTCHHLGTQRFNPFLFIYFF